MYMNCVCLKPAGCWNRLPSRPQTDCQAGLKEMSSRPQGDELLLEHQVSYFCDFYGCQVTDETMMAETLAEGWKTGRNHTSHTSQCVCLSPLLVALALQHLFCCLLLLSISGSFIPSPTKISRLNHVSSFIFFHLLSVSVSAQHEDFHTLQHPTFKTRPSTPGTRYQHQQFVQQHASSNPPLNTLAHY